MKKNKIIFYIIVFILLNISLDGYAYRVHISSKGTIPTKISLYNDSIFLTSFSSRDSILQLPDIDFNRLMIEAKGYIPVDTLCTSKDGILNIAMELVPLQLKEVVVTPDATLREEGINTIISNVGNSYIAEFGSVINGLEWVPGLMKLETGKIVIPGYGEPLIYVDGRRISSQSELNAIPTKEVAQIQILREPGASYPPGTKSVIVIKLRKHLSDYISLNPSVRYTQRRLPGVTPGLGFLFSTKKISGSLSATYTHSGSKPHDEQITLFNNDDLLGYIQQKKSYNLSNNLNLTGGLAYTVNSTSRIQAQYTGSLRHVNRNIFDKVEFMNNFTESTFERKICNSNNSHNVSLGYFMESDATELSVSVSYNAIRRDENEKYRNSEHVLDVITSPTHFDSFLSYCEFSHETFWGVFSGGYNLVYSNNITNYVQNEYLSNNHNRAYSFTPYIGFEKRIRKFTFHGAISYVYDKMHYYLPETFSRTYSVITPNLSLKYYINGRSISLGYNSRPEFPSYYELNPIKQQIDSLNYYQGNPDLRYCRYHNVTLNAGSFKGISTGISYSWRNNSVTEVLLLDPSNSLCGVYTPLNVGRYKKLQYDISYNLWRRNFNLFATGSLEYAHLSYPKEVSNPSSKNISGLIMVNCRYTIAKKYNIFTNSWYRSPYITTNQKIGYTLGVNIGISTSLLKKSLSISLTASDLFNRAVSPSTVTSFFSTSIRKSKFDYDGRSISISLSYTLNPLKIKYRKTDDYDEFNSRAASRD
ncbi:MAG: outer membrane beta-barrel protein [Bacteroidales bacterium]|nr:outer membrane beta-barrel protein [Bacteroidales bacterium]